MKDTRYYPARLVFSNRDVFAYYTNTFLYYAGDTRMPPRVPTQPCGGNYLLLLLLLLFHQTVSQLRNLNLFGRPVVPVLDPCIVLITI